MLKALFENLRYVCLFIPGLNRCHFLYQTLDSNACLTDHYLYLNLGYWKNNPDTLDQASEDMARLMADTAGLNSEHVILDVGFGFAEQDLFWLETYKPKKIYGLNLSSTQLLHTKKRLAQRGIPSSKFQIQKGDATHIPFHNETFDFVFGLETAMHFRSRKAFLKEAFRVLKPGGKIILTDICGRQSMRIKHYFLRFFVCQFWQLPYSNLYSKKAYLSRLQHIGFDTCSVDSIFDDVFIPFFKFGKAKIKSGGFSKPFCLIYRLLLWVSFSFTHPKRDIPLDYVFVIAQKPCSDLN